MGYTWIFAQICSCFGRVPSSSFLISDYALNATEVIENDEHIHLNDYDPLNIFT